MIRKNLPTVTVLLIPLIGAAGAQAPRASAPNMTASPLRLAAAKMPPAPKANGPTLEFTMEYIQDKLIGRGVLNYKVDLHDAAAGKDWSYEFTDKLSGTYANPNTCQIGFHWKQTRSGQVVTDTETYIDLSADSKLDVLPLDQYLTEAAAKSGHSTWSAKASPTLFVLRIANPDNRENNLVLPDEDMASHLAKAMLHAAELCTSAKNSAPDKEPF